MLKGLRKKESYNEILNELDKDPIKHYPNREATRLENSPYLSQLSGGLEEMEALHANVLKEKMKDTLLRDYSSTQGINITHARLKRDSSTDTPVFGAPNPDISQRVIHVQHSASDISRAVITGKRPQRFDIAHDYDPIIEDYEEMEIEEALHQDHQEQSKIERLTAQVHQDLGTSPQDTLIQVLLPAFDAQMPQVLEKRKHQDPPRFQEGGASSSSGLVKTAIANIEEKMGSPGTAKKGKKSEPALELQFEGHAGLRPPAPSTPPRQPSKAKPKASPEVSPRPKAKAKASPEEAPIPKAKAKAKAKAEATPLPKKTIKKEDSVKSERAVHGTKKITKDSFEEWAKLPIGEIVDQIHARKIYLSKAAIKRRNRDELIPKLIKHDSNPKNN
jgi:hypothetical protein